MQRRGGQDGGESAIRIAQAFMELTSDLASEASKQDDQEGGEGNAGRSNGQPRPGDPGDLSPQHGPHENGGGKREGWVPHLQQVGYGAGGGLPVRDCQGNGVGHEANGAGHREHGEVLLDGGGVLFPNALAGKESLRSSAGNRFAGGEGGGFGRAFDGAEEEGDGPGNRLGGRDSGKGRSFLERMKVTLMDVFVILVCMGWFCSVIPPQKLKEFPAISVLSKSAFTHGVLWSVFTSLLVLPAIIGLYAGLVQMSLVLSRWRKRCDGQSTSVLDAYRQPYVAQAHSSGTQVFSRIVAMVTFGVSFYVVSNLASETRIVDRKGTVGCVGRCLAGMSSPTEQMLMQQLDAARKDKEACGMREKSLELQMHHLRDKIRSEFESTDTSSLSLKAVPPREAQGGGGVRGGEGEGSSVSPPMTYPVLDELLQQKNSETDQVARARCGMIKSAFEYAWTAYEDYAFGWDELKPLTRKGQNVMGLGVTIIDSLDTMLVMGMQNSGHYMRARDWVREAFDHTPITDVSVFETTIRVLGGLLGAYALSGDELYREKSVLLADRLIHAFDTPTGIPASVVNLKEGASKTVLHNPFNGQTYRFGDATTLAEAGSLQLELQYLSHITGNASYAAKGDRAIARIFSIGKRKGGGNPPLPKGNEPFNLAQTTFSVDLHPREGRFTTDRVSMGSGGDSFYEYLLKQSLLMPESKQAMRGYYLSVVETALERVGAVNGGLAFVGESNRDKARPTTRMEHLACFIPGMLALGHTAVDGSAAAEHLDYARSIMKTCMSMYQNTRTGLAAESYDVATAHARGIKPNRAGKYSLLRPEAVESAFVMWRLTKDQQYRDFGWSVFMALEKHSKMPEGGGYSAIEDVMVDSGQYSATNRLDRMDSFLLSETFKYLYLLFCPDSVLPLEKYVFNTEAHPFPVLE